MSAAPFKKCACGRVYVTRAEWETLPDVKTFEGVDGALCEMRRCHCGSHITAALVEPLDASDLRRAVRVIDSMRESFNDEYTAHELLRLVKVCWMGEWDVTPDEWTTEQCANALVSGTIPRFEETRDGLHALGVADCRCRGCRRDRENAEEVAS